MMKIKPYPGYKDSGVDWLGDIPKDWTCSPGLSVLSKKKVKNLGMQESRVLSLSYGRIVIKPEEKLHGLVPESFETYQIVEPNDIIIRPTDLQNDFMSLRVGQVKDRGIITSAYICLVSRPPITRDYCYSLLNAYDLMKVYYGMGSGLRQNLDFADFRRLPVLVPSTDEQHQIVRFLDAKTRLINRFIRNKRRLIELLQEQKQTVINDCVTGKMEVRRIVDENGNSSFRLPPSSCKMRDSGIDWLGEIPEHWETVPIKRVASDNANSIVDGPFGSSVNVAQDYGDYSIPVVRTVNITDSGFDQRDLRFIREEKFEQLKRHAVRPNDILLSKVGTIGNACLFPSYFKRGMLSTTGSCKITVDEKKTDRRYILFTLRTMKEHLNALASANVQPFLNMAVIKNIIIPLPPLEEQREISRNVKPIAGQIDSTISRIQLQIDLIQEYRTRLIADVVTGKVDVRGIPVEDVPEDEALEELEDEMDAGLLDEDEYAEEA